MKKNLSDKTKNEGAPRVNPLGISLPRKRSTVEQIADRVREKILSGEMPQGARLPSTQELAKQWGTYVPAVHAALSILTNEGLLDRRHCRGTFVRQPNDALTRIGIYAAADLWEDSSDRIFPRQVFLLLQEFLLHHNIHAPVWFDNRVDEKVQPPWLPLIKAVNKKEIQALVALSACPFNAGWLNELPIPITGFFMGLRNRIDFNQPNFFELSLQLLAQKGCRSVGLISASPRADASHYDSFLKLAQQHGMETRPEWISPERVHPLPIEQFGYDQFRHFWSLPERPQALIVYPDTAARGVVLAISMLGVRVPKDLQLVFHRNAEVPFLCPLAVNYVNTSCQESAEAFYEQLVSLHRGESCPLKLLDYHLPGQSRSAANGRPKKHNDVAAT